MHTSSARLSGMPLRRTLEKGFLAGTALLIGVATLVALRFGELYRMTDEMAAAGARTRPILESIELERGASVALRVAFADEAMAALADRAESMHGVLDFLTWLSIGAAIAMIAGSLLMWHRLNNEVLELSGAPEQSAARRELDRLVQRSAIRTEQDRGGPASIGVDPPAPLVDRTEILVRPSSEASGEDPPVSVFHR